MVTEKGSKLNPDPVIEPGEETPRLFQELAVRLVERARRKREQQAAEEAKR